MDRFYSQTTGCTYLPSVHSNIPYDAVQITAERYDSVIANPAPGKMRGHDDHGLPILVELPLATVSGQEREWRDRELVSVAWLRDRHRDQLEIGVEPTLTSEQFSALLVFMQQLRGWPQSAAFPESSARPVAPDFLKLEAKR